MPACSTDTAPEPPAEDTVKVVLHFNAVEGAPRLAVEFPRWIWASIRLEAEARDFENEYDELYWLENEAKRYLLDDVSIDVDDSLSSRHSTAEDLRPLVKAKGYTLAGWARANGWSDGTARAALAGVRGKREGLCQDIRRKALSL